MSTTTEPRTLVTTQVYRVYIKASPEKVWEAITNPEWNNKYGYGCVSEYDLRPGGKYTGYTNDGMRAMGAPDVGIAGEILECDPPRRLVQTWSMLMDPEMAAEGFTRLTYEIVESRTGTTRLTLTHELEGAPRLQLLMSGGMDESAGGGWPWVLSDLKSFLETGTALNDGHH